MYTPLLRCVRDNCPITRITSLSLLGACAIGMPAGEFPIYRCDIHGYFHVCERSSKSCYGIGTCLFSGLSLEKNRGKKRKQRRRREEEEEEYFSTRYNPLSFAAELRENGLAQLEPRRFDSLVQRLYALFVSSTARDRERIACSDIVSRRAEERFGALRAAVRGEDAKGEFAARVAHLIANDLTCPEHELLPPNPSFEISKHAAKLIRLWNKSAAA